MLKKFFSYYKPHKLLFSIDLVCAFIVAVCNLFYPFIAKNIINVYVPEGNLSFVLIWAGVLLIIFIIKAILQYIIAYWGHVVGVRIQADMRRDFFKHIESLPVNFFDHNKTGTLMSRLVNDLMDISELAHHGPEDVFLSFITLIGVFIMLSLTNAYLAIIVFLFVPLCVIFAAIKRTSMKNAFTQAKIELAEVNANVETSISGIRVSKAYTTEHYELKKFEKTNENFKKARNNAYKVMGVFHSVMGLFTDVLYLVVLVAGGLFFYYGYIDTGEFILFLLYVGIMIDPIKKLVSVYEQIQNGMTGFIRFQEIMHKEAEKESESPINVDKLNGDIEFINVSFAYKGKEKYNNNIKFNNKRLLKRVSLKNRLTDGTMDNYEEQYNQEVISDLSFKIPQGSTVALVGSSGGGKTTLCHLLPRFYEVEKGIIKIDNYNIKDLYLKSLRKNIGIVAQDVFLFDGSIRENIVYGNLDASENDMIEAAKNANIHDFISSLKDGYDTYVGERGVLLSGGQKQRVAIARVFLKNPPILILDEATSSLDNITELQIQDALERLSQGRTTLIVAHRLSTIKNADEIIVLEEGRIIERGTHNELVKSNGVYASLYNNQYKNT